MKKKIIYNILIVFILLFVVGCDSKKISNKQNENNIDNNSSEVINTVKILIEGKEYKMNLDNNETTKSFIDLLPQEFNMKELNGNEKYIYLNKQLPTNVSNPQHINVGDVMLYGDNCLVIFYKSFDTSYSYTKIGYIDNLPNLGNSDIKVRIEK